MQLKQLQNWEIQIEGKGAIFFGLAKNGKPLPAVADKIASEARRSPPKLRRRQSKQEQKRQ